MIALSQFMFFERENTQLSHGKTCIPLAMILVPLFYTCYTWNYYTPFGDKVPATKKIAIEFGLVQGY